LDYQNNYVECSNSLLVKILYSIVINT